MSSSSAERIRAAKANRSGIESIVSATLPELRLQPGHHKRVRAGHPWAYSNEIVMDVAAKVLPRGGLVRLVAHNGEFLGIATFNPHTLIAARVLARDPHAVIDVAFLGARLQSALRLRERIYPGGFYRLIHAEADGLPGLIVDRFGDVLSVQLNTAGMDALRAPLFAALHTLLAPRAIVLRNDSSARGLEGLPLVAEMAHGALDGPIEVRENGAIFFADLIGGQKTGWFYDQRDNRAAVARLARGARVLDAYAYCGGFGVLAAINGAKDVVMIDRSESALQLAERSAMANTVRSACRFVRGEVFSELERLAAAGERFDLVITDPPAFVKSRKDLGAGSRGYRKLARLAAAVVAPGGLLFIASCSHHVEESVFIENVAAGIADAGREGRILGRTGAAMDHPVHPQLLESAYMKSVLLLLY
jgi:23S rRNA (cytosine1962-C5)-methyltransferase